jgi:hypothetical protein
MFMLNPEAVTILTSLQVAQLHIYRILLVQKTGRVSSAARYFFLKQLVRLLIAPVDDVHLLILCSRLCIQLVDISTPGHVRTVLISYI